MDREVTSSKLDTEEVEFETAVSLTGFGRYNIKFLLLCGLILMAVLIETMAMSYIIPAAECDLVLSLSEKTILSSVGFLAVVLSSLMWGFMGDTIGRKKIISTTTFISSFVGIASSFSPNSSVLIVLRFVNGFFISASSALIIVYLGEFHSDKYRPKVIAWTGTFIAFTSFVLPGFAWIILPMKWSFFLPGIGVIRPWRALIIVYSLPTLICTICLLRFPESPKYLWIRGKSNEALQILRKIYADNTRNAENTFPVNKLTVSQEIVAQLTKIETSQRMSKKVSSLFKLLWKQLAPLFAFPLLRNTTMSAIMQFGIFFSCSGFAMWFPEILIRTSFFGDINPNKSYSVCDAVNYKTNITNNMMISDKDICSDGINESVFIVTLVSGAVFATTNTIIGFVINLTGKKPLLVVLLLITGVAALVINFVESYLAIVLLSGTIFLAGAGVSVLNSIVVDLFPTNYGAMALAICLMFSRLGSMVGSNIIGYLLEYSCQSVYYMLGGEHLVLIMLVLLLPSPTIISSESSS